MILAVSNFLIASIKKSAAVFEGYKILNIVPHLGFML